MAKKEGSITITSNNTNRQVQSPPSSRSRNPTPATALLPPREGDNSPPAAVHLPLEGNSLPNSQASNNNVAISSNSNNNNTTSNNIASNSVSNQTNSQANQVPPLNPTPAIAHLPPGEGSNYLPGDAHLPSEAGASPPQPNTTTAREENNSSQANSPPATNNPSRASQAGHSNNPPRASRQGTRHSPGINPLNLPLRPVQPPGKVPPPPHPPAAPAKVLLRKNLTLSGSLTFPTNLWPQHKGLFWLKGPTLRLPLGSLLT